MKAVLFSGGLPKPMMPLLGKPLLERIAALLRENGFDELCLTLRYRPEVVRSYFGDGSRFGVRIEYREETVPLGTAGAVKNCLDFTGHEPFLVMSGDCACDFDLGTLFREHKEGVTIALSSHAEPETILTESKEENRRPAYRDAEPPRRMSAENGTGPMKESGERIRIKNRDSVLTQKPGREIEPTGAGKDSAISGRRVSVKEKNVTAVAERSQNIETGRPLIREKNRTENRAPENSSPVREKSRTFPDAAESGCGNGQSVPRMREQSARRIPDTKPANAKPSERNGFSAPSGSEKIRITTGDVSEYQSEFSVRLFQDVENYVQNVKSGDQIGVRERIAKIRMTENRPSGNAWDRETATRDGNGSERTPVKTKDTPGYRAESSNAETPVRERLEHVTKRRPNAEMGENRISRGETSVPEKLPTGQGKNHPGTHDSNRGTTSGQRSRGTGKIRTNQNNS